MEKSAICPTCVAEGAPEPATVDLRGLCKTHYRRGLADGTVKRRYAPRGSQTGCVAPECDRKAKAHGLCSSHLARQYRGVDPFEVPSVRRAPECSFDGCDKPNHADGLCAGHATQRRNGKPLAPLHSYVRREGVCRIDLCHRAVANDGLCKRHYQRKIEGEVNWERPEIRSKAAHGSGHLDRNGYRVIQHEGRKRFEHSVSAEQVLGRALLPTENVHHVNGNRADNSTNGPFVMDERARLRSGNLEIWSKAQPPGQEIGPKVDWALDMLEQYGEFLDEARAERARRVLGGVRPPVGAF